MPVMEDEHGTYIMNSKDLRAVEHVKRLIDIGVDSLKIEGRTKSHYYVARTAQTYRQAIDDALAGRAFQPELIGVLENLAKPLAERVVHRPTSPARRSASNAALRCSCALWSRDFTVPSRRPVRSAICGTVRSRP